MAISYAHLEKTECIIPVRLLFLIILGLWRAVGVLFLPEICQNIDRHKSKRSHIMRSHEHHIYEAPETFLDSAETPEPRISTKQNLATVGLRDTIGTPNRYSIRIAEDKRAKDKQPTAYILNIDSNTPQDTIFPNFGTSDTLPQTD